MVYRAIVKRPGKRPFGANIKLADGETMVGAITRLASEGEMSYSGDWNVLQLNSHGVQMIYAGRSTCPASDSSSITIRYRGERLGIEGTLILFKYDGCTHSDLNDADVIDIANLIKKMDIGWNADGDIRNEDNVTGWCYV